MLTQNALVQFSFKQLEKALNAYLALDPEAKKNLASLQGKIITIHLAGLELNFQLRFNEQQVELTPGAELPAEVTVSGTPLSLFSLALRKDRKQSFLTEAVVLSGDAEVGQQIIALFDNLEIDWEEYLAKAMGDLPAHQLGKFARRFKNWSQEASAAFQQNVSDYIHEEKPWFPPTEALNDFYREVDETRMSCDRLEARVQNLIRE